MHLTSVQSHGDDVAFQFLSDGGFPHCCRRLSNIVRSEVENCCELTKKNWIVRMKRKESVCGGFVIFPVRMGWRWFWLPGKI